MTKKVGPNEPCPCGSGKKHKKCCGAVGAEALAAGAAYDRIDRDSVYRMVTDQVEYELSSWVDYEDENDGENDGARAEPRRATRSLEERYWGEYGARSFPESLPRWISENIQICFTSWVAFDVRAGSGARLVDQLLGRKHLRAGERVFLEAMKRSAMRPYEVAESRPGESLTLRDLLEGTTTIVHEPQASKVIPSTGFLLARVVPCGISGKPELEGGVLLMPNTFRQLLLDKIAEHRAMHQLAHPERSIQDADKELTPFFNQLALKALFADSDKQGERGAAEAGAAPSNP